MGFQRNEEHPLKFDLLVVVGSKRALAIAVKNDKIQKRFTWHGNRVNSAQHANSPSVSSRKKPCGIVAYN